MFVQWLYVYKSKARNPGNIVVSKKEEAGFCEMNRVRNNIPPPSDFLFFFYVSTPR